MKPSTTVLSTAVIAAIVGMCLSSIPAAAQQKPNTTPELVRNVDEPGFNVYQFSSTFTTDVVGIADAELPVPPGKVAVIEHVSASGALEGSTGIEVRALLRCQCGGGREVRHSVVLVPQGVSTNGLNFFTVSQPIKCYATTATSTSGGLSFHLESNTIQASQHIWIVAVSGYTVPQ